MPSYVSSAKTETVGPVNSTTAPRTIPCPAGLAAGMVLVVVPFYAQGNGGSSTTFTIPAGFQKISSDGTSTNRAGVVYWTIVEDPADFAAGIVVQSSSTSSRVPGVAVAYSPTAGKRFDPTTVSCTGPEYFSTAGTTSDTYPASTPTKALELGIQCTNKGAGTALTRHIAAGGGTNLVQAWCPSTAVTAGSYPGSELAGNTDPDNAVSVSDSVVSIVQGGTGVTFSTGQANGQAYRFAIDEIDDTEPEPELPVVTGRGFGNVRTFLQTRHSCIAHRNAGLGTSGSSPANGYPEMTEYGVRMAANAGFGIIEISCQRTSDGGWIGAHDQTFDRVTLETTYDGQNYSARTTAEVLALHVNAGTTGGAQPYATLQTLIATLPEDFIFLIDPKQAGGTGSYLTAFMDIVDSLLGPSRAIIKIDGAATASRFQAVKDYESTSEPGVEYITAAYWYDTTTDFATTIPAKLPYVDLAGLNVDPNEAAGSYWTSLRSMCNAQTAIDGKQRYIWAHVIQQQTRYDQAIALGADFLQVSNAALTPIKGVSAWRPYICDDGFAAAELYVTDGSGTAHLAQRVQAGDEVLWER